MNFVNALHANLAPTNPSYNRFITVSSEKVDTELLTSTITPSNATKTLSLRCSFKDLSIREKLDLAKTLIDLDLKGKRFGTVAKYAAQRIIDHLNYQTLICNPSIESLAHSNGARVYCDDHVSRGIKVVEQTGYINIVRRGRNQSNVYEINFDKIESMVLQPALNPDPTTVVVLTKNKNIREEFFLEGVREEKPKTKKAWIDPYPLPPDFQFSDEEKLIIIKTHNINDIELEVSFEDWKGYNVNRTGFNWFSSYNRFCSQRKWEKVRFGKRKFQENIFNQELRASKPQQSPFQIKAARMFRQEKPKLRKHTAPDMIERIKLESELNDAYLKAGITNKADRDALVKQEMNRSFER